MRAAADLLRSDIAVSIFTLGFCFGAGHSWTLAASDLSLAGAIGFYGQPSAVDSVVEELSAPLLMLVAGDDRNTPASAFCALGERLRSAGKEHEIFTYEGAPHSFFDREHAQWQDACQDAWQRLTAFCEAHDSSGNHEQVRDR